MKYFVYILYLTLIFSCSKKQAATEITKAQPELTFISTDKKMLKVDGGQYRAFVGKESDSLTSVKSFMIDETAVTNFEYLEFLKKNPQWTKSKVLKLYADSTYLKHWKSDFEIPADVSPDAPVTNVSWFAAKAYAESVGKRLPTVDEWEYAARASENLKNATEDPEFTRHILNLYQEKGKYKQAVKQHQPNAWGIYDMYGTIWEWTEDFNSVMMTGESRKDTDANESLFCAGASVTSSDLRNYAAFIRFAMRGSMKANYTVNNLGFRCAKDLDENEKLSMK
ncbi:formylglycine-generating enzyme family protein [Soonwooa sp.]|uniref:formylglycine-generating enzyme family protein n=1 Tax=Soonwooa sp. TaxID=1938592 RepID=UPI00261B3138|nr:formylglycine-generating enzyme family protein [Soonwooa sp.]